MDRLYTSVDIAEYLYSKHQVMKSFIRRFFSTSLSTELPVVVLFTLYHYLTLLTLNTINVYKLYTLVTRTLLNTFISCFIYISYSLKLHSQR